MTKYATVVRGTFQGLKGQITGTDGTNVQIRTSVGQEISVNRNWIIATSYDREIQTKSRLFG